ncbi:MAG: hypothetical protein ACE5EA_05755 [Nitrospirota bacterium]
MDTKSIIKYVVVFIFIILSGCTTFRERAAQRVYDPESVKIYQEESLIPYSYKIIGEVSAETPIFVQYNEAYSKLEGFLKIEAYKLGANGIVNIKIYERVNPETSLIDRQFSSILQGKGDAIVILKKEKKEVELLDEELQTLKKEPNSPKKGVWRRFIGWIGGMFGH